MARARLARPVWRRTGHPAPRAFDSVGIRGDTRPPRKGAALPFRMEKPVTRDNETFALLGRWLAGIVLALMAASTVYTAWIVIANFGRIGV
jgi:hypothetical protein